MRRDKGQSLIEVIVACSVGILVVTALTFATIFSLRNASFAKNSAQATKLAQEGIESVRIGRDRNKCINFSGSDINSWNGNSDDDSCPGAGAIWDYQIYQDCVTDPAPNCYFKIVTSTGALSYLGPSSSIPLDVAESIAPNFKRVVILSDDSATYTTQKTVTVIVRWSDATGAHESKLTTILRKL